MAAFRRTKIVATIGPASDSPEVLAALIQAGVDVVRLNFSHGDLDEKARQIDLVRRLAREAGSHVSLLQDLQGPKIRVGRLRDGGVLLVAGSTVQLTSDLEGEGDAVSFGVSYPRLAAAVQAGSSIFLDDGLLELKVVAASADAVSAVVIRGGLLTDHKGVNLPGAALDVASLTAKDVEDLRFGLKNGVDFVALSFVRGPGDVEPVREIMREEGVLRPVIAKIEKQEALTHLRRVVRAFDGVMVARGDLGVELAPEKVPAAQKLIIDRARRAAKPVITATQMLESMTHNPRPTRAEASDVANAVLDGTDAVMLSGETAIGAYPVEAVAAMDRIVREAESIPVRNRTPFDAGTDAEAVCAAAVLLAEELDVAAITALTRSGQTAMTLSRLRSRIPVLAFLTSDEALARRLRLWRGVTPFVVAANSAPGETLRVLEHELRQGGLLPPGSQVVVVGAAPGSPAGRTNFIRLLRL